MKGKCPLEDASQLPTPAAQGDVLGTRYGSLPNSALGFHPMKIRMSGGGTMGGQISKRRDLKWLLHAGKIMLRDTRVLNKTDECPRILLTA